MVVILLYKISWQTIMKEFKNILCTKSLKLQHHLDKHRLSIKIQHMNLNIGDFQ